MKAVIIVAGADIYWGDKNGLPCELNTPLTKEGVFPFLLFKKGHVSHEK